MAWKSFSELKKGSQKGNQKKPDVILTKYPKFELRDIMDDDLMSLFGKVIVVPNPKKGSARKERTVRRAMSNFPHYKKTNNV